MKKLLVILIFALGLGANDDIVGFWYSHPDSTDAVNIVEIYEEHGEFKAYGFDQVGEKKNVTNKGLIFVYGLKKDKNQYKDGKIYNPEDGKTHYLKGKIVGDEIHFKASIDKSGFFGKTLIWKRAEGEFTPLPREQLRSIE